MATLDGDWVCDDDDLESGLCFAVWVFCHECADTKVPELEWYNGGLVARGQGLAIADQQGNMWYESAAELGGKYDICGHCMGSGGGYMCGYHDDDEDY